MPLSRLLTATALSALFAGSAFAMPEPAQKPDPAPVTEPAVLVPSPMPAPTPAVDPNAPAVVLLSSPTPPEEAWKLKAGDPTVVTNGPVPDTAENRARYGGPLSNGGLRTTPAGN